MGSRNNRELRLRRSRLVTQQFGIRKLTMGVASVVVAAGVLFSGYTSVIAVDGATGEEALLPPEPEMVVENPKVDSLTELLDGTPGESEGNIEDPSLEDDSLESEGPESLEGSSELTESPVGTTAASDEMPEESASIEGDDRDSGTQPSTLDPKDCNIEALMGAAAITDAAAAEEEDPAVCTVTTKTTVVENEFHLHAETELVDTEAVYQNTSYVKNEDNPAHDLSNPDINAQFGTGDLEYNFWQVMATNAYSQSFRLNFGVEVGVLNPILKVTLPYVDKSLEDLYYEGLLTISNASQYLVNNIYNGKSLYDETIDVRPSFEFTKDNEITFNLRKLDPRTALSMEFRRTFANQADFDANSAKVGDRATADVTGTYNLANIDLPTASNKTTWTNYSGDLADLGIEARFDVSEGDVFESIDVVRRPGDDVSINGYISKQMTTYKILKVTTLKDEAGNDILDENGLPTYCYDIEKTVDYMRDFSMNAESVMDTTIPDYPNNGFLKKVYNDTNHRDVPGETFVFGPGNTEVQHWQTGPNEDTTAQYWRVVVATDYAVENGVLKINFPYEISLDDVNSVSTWLSERYYPAVGDGNYSNLEILLGLEGDNDLKSRMKVIGNTLTIDLSDVIIPARTTFGVMISKKFDTPQDFSADLKHVTSAFTGQWYFNNIELPHTETEIQNDCPECVIPTTSSTTTTTTTAEPTTSSTTTTTTAEPTTSSTTTITTAEPTTSSTTTTTTAEPTTSSTTTTTTAEPTTNSTTTTMTAEPTTSSTTPTTVEPPTTITQKPVTPSEPPTKPQAPGQSTSGKALPDTGEGDESLLFSAGVLAVLSGLGLTFTAKKRKED